LPKAISALWNLADKTDQMLFLRNSLISLAGKNTIYILSKVVIDNAWVSNLIFSYLNQGKEPFKTIETTITAGSAFFAFCASSWLVRQLWAKMNPVFLK
jgi:hypothetical protein